VERKGTQLVPCLPVRWREREHDWFLVCQLGGEKGNTIGSLSASLEKRKANNIGFSFANWLNGDSWRFIKGHSLCNLSVTMDEKGHSLCYLSVNLDEKGHSLCNLSVNLDEKGHS
jgi:hypothetical protein